jgi:hypothetical protein
MTRVTSKRVTDIALGQSGLKMRRIDDISKSLDCSVRNSLSTLRATHVRLNLLEGTCATAALLASKIKLYDVLLDELVGIHTDLAKDLEHGRKTPPASVAVG